MLAGSAPRSGTNLDATEIRFTRGARGARIAHTRHGDGPPLVVVACWLSHLQHDWESPVWRHFLEDLGAFTTLVRYDLRGHGLSDWEVTDFSLEAHVRDLEAVVAAEGLDRFALMGMSGYCPVALEYAARHPDQVSRLVVYGGSSGWPPPTTDEERDEETAWLAMMRAGWARPEATFRHVFTQAFIPGATEQQMAWFDNLQRLSTSARNAVAARIERTKFDVTGSLGMISAPTLVLHALRDGVIDFDRGRAVATGISGARFVPLESANHILLADEPAWQVFVREVHRFMKGEAAGGSVRLPSVDQLSHRELEILRFAAAGLDNASIAARLVISVRTVERRCP